MVRARRSLTVSPQGIRQANKAIQSFASKTQFADELAISRATVQKFFAGKPVGRENFHKICQKLKLPWQEITSLAEATVAQSQQIATPNNACDLDILVQEVRRKGHASIQQRCEMMRVLDMSQPVKLNDIYSDTYILKKISGCRRIEIADIPKLASGVDRPNLNIFEQRVSALEAVKQNSKLLILGKPGAGKATFLKYVAFQCSLGKFQADLVPIFIRLKDFGETFEQPSLLKYINDQFASCGIKDTVAKQILSQGRALVLLEGLDQVREADEDRVLQEIRNFTTKFHINHFVITCRIAAREYIFEQFTEVEIADFNDQQIANFVTKWFGKDAIKGNNFIKELKQNPPFQELASNPLLLTLLCLAFEESAFPTNRAEFYKEALNLLLKKWDAKRNIERSPIYKKLSVQQKEDLLNQIAQATFKRCDYYFRRQEIKQYIIDYISNIPGINSNNETLHLDSEVVLKLFEAHHGILIERARGIYSFSHLALQEYFTAKEIVTSSNPQALQISLTQLVSHITDKRWHEVFLLAANMLQNADYLMQLAKQQIDSLVSQDNYLQKFLAWINQKSCVVNVTYKLVAVRAFYLDISLGLNIVFNPELSLALKLDSTLGLDLKIGLNRELNVTSLAHTLNLSLNSEWQHSLQHFRQPPNFDQGEELNELHKSNIETWNNKLKDVQTRYCDIKDNWQFNVEQMKLLQQYHDANNLLVNCLKSSCYMTHAVREEIENTLLLAPS